MVKNLPAMWETWVQSLGWEDPLENGTVTHCSILAWRIPWTEEPGGLQSMGSQRVRYNWATFTFIMLSFDFLHKLHLLISYVALLVKNPPANAGDGRDEDLICGWGRSPGEGNGNQLQYSCLGNLMNRRA